MFKINLLIFSNNSYFLVRFNKPISINVIKLMKGNYYTEYLFHYYQKNMSISIFSLSERFRYA